MTQKNIDDLFSLSSSSTRSSTKRSRANPLPTNDRDDFDDIFETKRRCTKNSNHNKTKSSTDVFDFDTQSTSMSTMKKRENDNSIGSSAIKRRISDDNDDEKKAIDELFNNNKQKKIRPQIKHEESTDLLDMFKTRKITNVTQTITSTMDGFKIPITSKNLTTQKKVKMFFDDSDLVSLREQVKQQNDIKDYTQIKPVLVTGGQWLSKEAETKSKFKMNEPLNTPTISSDIPDDERNLMHIQYASLVVDDEYENSKKSKSNSVTSKFNKQTLDGKSFRKQHVQSDTTIVRKENFQSCYNALLEDLNKPRMPTTTTSSSSLSSNKPKKSAKSKISQDIEIILSDEEQMDAVDFFDLPSRTKKF
ncbi:unnamed protein product [Rotaria socialis]|uniref:Uncharacterized protein n=1 Tax=Rotaria socialis TaxID=392032 RepID=A0A820EPK1_9BILA|nr:unnamed protein product [Rotaria socialis]CAF3599937.1 unnamed protein product [Rotaria socialis]CAF4192265.1 unnamed protein product [Rotaria socialis]CAF4249212.1 unnamed protein product [Rotaria socialis]